ncbi:MAG: TIGR02099 family protein [Lysobacteraceae bacterium]|nr:MAG: TIGR02099 family protein [Xanthomonadaceae bacterium]
MPTSIRRRLRLARRGLWCVTAGGLVLLALALGVVSQLLPLAERHPDRIAEWLSARAGRTVSFDAVKTEWTRRGPLLRLNGLRVGEGKDAIVIGAAEILVSQYAGVLPGRSFTELRVHDLELTLQRNDDGRWRVRGLPGQNAGGDPLGALEGLGELQVIDAKLGISAPSLQIETTIPEVDLRLRVDGARVRAGVRAWMRRETAPLDAVLDFDRDSGNGRLYTAARRADLSLWTSLLRGMGATVMRGRGRVEVWASLRTHQIAAVDIDADLRDLGVHGAPLADGGKRETPVVEFTRLRGRTQWRVGTDGWRLDAPEMQIHFAGQRDPQTLDGLLIAGGKRYGLRAERIDTGPLFAVAALSDLVDPGLRRWLAAAKPGGVAKRIHASGIRGGDLRIDAAIEDLHFAAVGNSPGVSGLSGRLHGDADALRFAFDDVATARFDWPRGFGVVHDLRLRGEAVGWRDGDRGWRVETPGLRIDGKGYGADVRGGLWFQGDGTRPAIDVVADLDDALAPTAKLFWPHYVMPASLVEWLNHALVGGTVRDGRAVVSGDLDDWPFVSHDGMAPKGVFDARASLRDMRVKFSPDWPATADMDAEIAFIGNGFHVAGKAQLAEVGIREFSAGIADFGRGELVIDAMADADAAKFLALLKQSPLREDHGATMARLSVAGPASASFGMKLDLQNDTRGAQIRGDVQLRGVRMAEAEWNLAFADVRGQARYDQDGFDAGGLRALYDRQSGKLSLRAGPGHVRDRRQGFEADLEVAMSAADLLGRSTELDWLKPYASGRSRWTTSIAIPIAAGPATKPGARRTAKPASASATHQSVAGEVSRLQLRSDLVGTALTLPAPMHKPAGMALPTTIDLELPLGSGEVAVAFGQRLALRARKQQGQMGIRAMFGGERVVESPPLSGLALGGRTTTLDVIGWVALTHGGDGDGLKLQRVDAMVDRLQLVGAEFADTRLQAQPTANGLSVQFDAATLAGTLLVPKAESAAISGHLQRLHWRAAKTVVDQADAVVSGSDFDPAKIPALSLRVDDLRVAGATLGEAQFRSRPTANGMEIDQLQTRAPKRRLDLSGDWSGRGVQARTRLQAIVASDDFGALLADLGVGGRVEGGKGDARFEAVWPGSPMAFRLGEIDGALKLNIKGGRLVEVEPGAGRVLGLLSIAELPRRLTLDFRDFFAKGFAFNKLAGTVTFGSGAARSDNLVIDGPSAQINIRGAANLRAQTFDQTIEVVPKAGNLLTAVGAIAGGPVGAAVGAVANAVLHKPIGQAAAKNYRVTGPWKDPKVEVVERQTAAARPAG